MLHPKITKTIFFVAIFINFGCGSSEDFESADSCVGVVDTMDVVEHGIHNTGDPLWNSEQQWEIVEEMRFGTGRDSIFFSSIISLDVDNQGRLYVLDSQTQQIFIFNSKGGFVGTVGSKGPGPGEFENATAVDVSEAGEIWVMEMQLGKLTVLDAQGNYLRTERVNSTGWDYRPYPGGFDRVGNYNAVTLCYDYEEEETKTMLARFDPSFTPIDTVAIPQSPVEIEFFEHIDSDGGSYSIPVPFHGSFEWIFSARGNVWTLYTGTYELVEMTPGGVPLRRVTKEFEPLPVTDTDRENVQRMFDWFRNQGGTIDETRIPRNKPIVDNLFGDDEGNLWVMHSEPGDTGSRFDIFNAAGQFLGEVNLSFVLEIHSGVKVQDGILFGVTEDEDRGEIVVRSRIQR